MENTKNKQHYVIHYVRHSCTWGKEWSVNTNKYISEHEPLMCEKCDGYITVDQIPEGMKFKERLGTY